MASSILSDNGVSSGSAGIKTTADSTGSLALQTTTAAGAATTALTINTSQNVGIGTTSPAGKLDVSQSAAGVARHYLRNTNSGVGAYTILDLVNDSGNNIGEFFCTSSTNTSAFGTNATVLQAATSNPLIFGTNGTEVGRFDSAGLFKFNSGYGSVATAYGCRAWVNFNGQGTVAIRASGNVSSITDFGTGSYTVNFTTAMPDANYSAVAAQSIGSSYFNSTMLYGHTTTFVNMLVYSASTEADPLIASVAIFR